MEDRRQKYTNNPVKNKSLKINVRFDITQLDLMCSYIVSENRSIRRGNIVNLRNLLEVIDMSTYGNDQECLSRIDFIKKGIDARLNHNLTSTIMILNHIAGGFGVPINNTFNELSNNEVDWISSTISAILKDSVIYNDIDEGLSLLTKFKATDFKDRGDIVKQIESWVGKLQSKFRKAKADTAEDLMFSLIGDNYLGVMAETYRQLTSPSNKLIFGTQALNLLTGGGLESSRVYTLLGLPGEGKSSTMLDMAIQLKRYNRGYRCNDPTKRPCVVLLVMENSIKETVQRLFSMCIGKGMEEYTEQQAIELLQTDGNLHVSDNDPIDLIIRYKPNLSVDTSYLYTMTEDLEDDGYEVICVLQDYLKRIRSVDGMFGGDLRLQLGAVVNEFKVFATLKNVPVVTASQLNRTATNSIDAARIKNKSDLVRLIGRGNVGESNLILENSDWIALIAPEQDRMTGERYLGIQRVKSRYFIPDDFHCAYIPYSRNTIKFIEDFGSPMPAHKITMREEIELNNGISNGIAGGINEIQSFSDIGGNTVLAAEQNIFSNATMVTRRLSQYIPQYYVTNPYTQTTYYNTQENVEMCKIVTE